MGPISCPQTSVKDYHSTLRNSPEKCRPYQHRGGSLKLREEKFRNHRDLKICVNGLSIHIWKRERFSACTWACVLPNLEWDTNYSELYCCSSSNQMAIMPQIRLQSRVSSFCLTYYSIVILESNAISCQLLTASSLNLKRNTYSENKGPTISSCLLFQANK
jgi:hypothetical protein